MDSHIIRIDDGKTLTFNGYADDVYFQNLSAFHAQNHQLRRFIPSLPADAVVLDVGANIGLTVLTIASALPGGRVYGFEPSPRNAHYLRENVRLNEVDNVVIVETAVGEGDGVVSFHLAPSGAHSSVIRGKAPKAPNIADVPIISLDNWATANRIARVDFIKIDVEGYEQNVLAGAANLLADQRPLVLMEFNSVTIAFEARLSPLVFVESLISAFDIFSVAEDANLVPITNADLRGFVFKNMTEHGCVDDIFLRPRVGLTASDIRRAASTRGADRPAT